MLSRASLIALIAAGPAFADEVNVYSLRQPELVQGVKETDNDAQGAVDPDDTIPGQFFTGGPLHEGYHQDG